MVRKRRRTRIKEAKTPLFKGSTALATRGTKRHPGEITRVELWRRFDKLFRTRSEVSRSILKIAGRVVSRGYITHPQGDGPDAEKAKKLCDDFAGQISLDQLIYEGTIWLCLHGNSYIEKKLIGQKIVDARLFPWQDQIEPSEIAEDGEVAGWRQVRYGREIAVFSTDELTGLRLPPVDEDGFGTSLIESVMLSVITSGQVDRDIKDYLHKSAWPKEMYQVGEPGDKVDDSTVSEAYAKVKRWKPGDSYIANYPVKYTACGVGQVESRAFPEIIKVLNNRSIDGLIVPPLSMLYNATEASARAMLDDLQVAIIQPIQRIWKRKIETEIFKPLIVGEAIDEKFTPSIDFMPPTEEEISLKAKRIIEMYVAGLQWGAPLISREEARAELDIKDLELKKEELPVMPRKDIPPEQSGEKPPEATQPPPEVPSKTEKT